MVLNIGAFRTSVLLSLGSSKNTKRTALAHVLFNIIRTIIFITLSLFIAIDKMALNFSKPLPAEQLDNLRTLLIVLLLRGQIFQK